MRNVDGNSGDDNVEGEDGYNDDADDVSSDDDANAQVNDDDNVDDNDDDVDDDDDDDDAIMSMVAMPMNVASMTTRVTTIMMMRMTIAMATHGYIQHVH